MGKEGRLDDAQAKLEKLRAEYARAMDSIRTLCLEREA